MLLTLLMRGMHDRAALHACVVTTMTMMITDMMVMAVIVNVIVMVSMITLLLITMVVIQIVVGDASAQVTAPAMGLVAVRLLL